MNQYLFIYGTLIPDIAPDEISGAARKLEYIGEGFVYGKLYDLGDYPAAVLNSNSKVFGRIYKLPDDENILPELDEYEGYDPQNLSESLYLRKKAKVYLNGRTLSCWIYEYNQDTSKTPLIESGNFLTIQTT